MILGTIRTLRALRFLVLGPFLLLGLFFLNLVTSPGTWWVQWAALGIGVVWLLSLLRVLRAALLVGGLAALWVILQRGQAGPGGTVQPPGPGGPDGAGPRTGP